MSLQRGPSIRRRSISTASTYSEKESSHKLKSPVSPALPPIPQEDANTTVHGLSTGTNLIEPTIRLVGSDPYKQSSSKGSTDHTPVPSRNPSLFKELPSLPVDTDDLHDVPLSPSLPTSSSPPRSKFPLSLPKLPHLRTGEYLKSIPIPSTWKVSLNPFAKSSAPVPPASGVHANELSHVPSLKVHLENGVPSTRPPDDLYSITSSLVSPTATGYLYPHREDHSRDLLPKNKPLTDRQSQLFSDIRRRNLVPSPASSRTNSTIKPRYPNSSLRIPPLLRTSTTPNLTDKFPIPRAISYGAKEQSELSSAKLEAGSPFLLSLGIESIGRWTGFKWVLLVSVLTVVWPVLTIYWTDHIIYRCFSTDWVDWFVYLEFGSKVSLSSSSSHHSRMSFSLASCYRTCYIRS